MYVTSPDLAIARLFTRNGQALGPLALPAAGQCDAAVPVPVPVPASAEGDGDEAAAARGPLALESELAAVPGVPSLAIGGLAQLLSTGERDGSAADAA